MSMRWRRLWATWTKSS